MFPANNLDQFLIKYFEELNKQSWTLIPTQMDFALQLQNSAKAKLSTNQFKPAGITQSTEPRPSIRNDQIFWLDKKTDSLTPIDRLVLERLNALTHCLKNYFRISLTEFECHYAVYETGHFYQKHLDTTHENNKRIFSFVIYLNENWEPQDGGQLLGYAQNEKIFEILPRIGQMVLFKSDLEHEVLATHKTRHSLTGWIRR